MRHPSVHARQVQDGRPVVLRQGHQTAEARDRRFGRRSFLAAAGAGAVAAALPIRPRLGGPWFTPEQSLAAKLKPFKAKLPIPEVITDAEFTLEMAETEVEILPGRPTKMWTYGGTFPGPTIRRPAGDPTEVTFDHQIPDAGALSIHLHGGHTAAIHDGQPGTPPPVSDGAFVCELPTEPATAADAPLIAPGESRTYIYEGMEDGAPERAAFQWYHDHRCHATGRNVWRGLAGMYILDDEFEGDNGIVLPSGSRDIPLLITDRTFNNRNQLKNPYKGIGHAPNDGITGNLILVNGVYLPQHKVSARRYRLRILNASNFRSYNLELSNGAKMTQIATEAGLMPAPLKRKRILIGPAERVEVIVDFGDFPNRDVVLRSRRGPSGSKAFEGPLMRFRVGGRRHDASAVPDQLRPLPAWTDDVPEDIDKTWEIGIGTGLRPKWLINGEAYYPEHIEHQPEIDTTETWELHNDTGVAHLVHLHHTDWYMLSRNGAAPPPWEDCLKETFFLDPGDRVEVAGHFSDHLGKYVVHCHMLDHEDHGLMSHFKVVP